MPTDSCHFLCTSDTLVRPQNSLTRKALSVNLASRWKGVRLPRASGKSPDFPGSSPNFPGSFSATSPEVLSLWNLTANQRFPGSFPDFPGSSPNFPGSSRTSLEVSPCLWEACHPHVRLCLRWAKSGECLTPPLLTPLVAERAFRVSEFWGQLPPT